MPTKASHLIPIAVFAIALSGFAATPAGAARMGRPTTVLAHESQLDRGILAKLNQIRRSHNLVSLTADPELGVSSAQHSAEMATDGYFAHESISGAAFWKRIRRHYPTAGWRLWSVGENLLWSTGTIDADKALQLWMASPEHRANILDPHWRQIGIASVHATAAPGVYHGLDITVITTDFGIRR